MKCEACGEAVARHGDRWVHPHSGDERCGTGDGATAWPLCVCGAAVEGKDCAQRAHLNGPRPVVGGAS